MSITKTRGCMYALVLAVLGVAWADRAAPSAPAQSAAAPVPAGIVVAGTTSATPWFVREGGAPGPTVIVVGGVHGDEAAGATAAAQICTWPVVRGRLVVVPRANVTALAAGRRLMPGVASEDANLNRNFPLSATNAPRGELAAALWEFVREQKPDWLVDLHEGGDVNGTNRSSVGSSVIAGPDETARAAAAAMKDAVNATITNAAIQFRQLGPGVTGSLMRATREQLGSHTLILETTIKGQPLSRRTRQHRVMMHTLLARLGMVDASVTPDLVVPPAPHARDGGPCRVAVYDADGTGGTGVPRVATLLGARSKALVTLVCPEDIRGGVLESFDVVVFPGGSGSREAAGLGEEGRVRVRNFIEDGGGYLGICAGAYLATSEFAWGLKILNAKTVSPKWARGHAEVRIEFTERGRAILGAGAGERPVRYANGPILCPAGVEGLPPYEVLAFFRSEVAEHGTPVGVMTGSPALVSGLCGKGRVICSSPHPEQTQGLEDIVPRAIAWLAAGESAKAK